MKDMVLCPFKETMVYVNICETKCSYSREKCEDAKAVRLDSLRHCVHCRNDGVDRLCDPCLSGDARERPFWAQEKPAAEGFVPYKQMSLF